MDTLDQLAVALGFATLAGLNLYLTVLVTGMAIHFQWIALLPKYEALAVLGEPPILIAATVLFLLEFFADKIPWVDSLWDFLHTVIRPVGGSLLALQALGDTSPALDVVIALVAGSATMVTHGFKAGTRLAINASPEPVSNITASVLEDAAVVGASVLMWTSPKIALLVFVAFLAVAIYATPRIYRVIHASLWLVLQKLRAPATGRERAPRRLPSRITAHEDTLLSAELAGRQPEILWALPVLTARSRGVRSLVPNLFGKIIAEKSRPGIIFFVGRKNWNSFLRGIPLVDCNFIHEPRFFSEDLVIHNKKTKLRVILRFSRSEALLVDSLIRQLEELQSTTDPAPPAGPDLDDSTDADAENISADTIPGDDKP